ncbi:hypothetical protein KKA02_02420, partial [Patescibacteria group bacterium]|nr:hypothetical protein [Patescibacteria group bacterium]
MEFDKLSLGRIFMVYKIKGNPRVCPYCKLRNFIHIGTAGHSRITGFQRDVIINKNFFCNRCKKYFSSQTEMSIV